MVLKTFNVDDAIFNRFSKVCKENGMSMSRQVQMFMEAAVSDEPEVREEYLRKLERIRKGKFIQVKSVGNKRKK